MDRPDDWAGAGWMSNTTTTRFHRRVWKNEDGSDVCVSQSQSVYMQQKKKKKKTRKRRQNSNKPGVTDAASWFFINKWRIMLQRVHVNTGAALELKEQQTINTTRFHNVLLLLSQLLLCRCDMVKLKLKLLRFFFFVSRTLQLSFVPGSFHAWNRRISRLQG